MKPCNNLGPDPQKVTKHAVTLQALLLKNTYNLANSDMLLRKLMSPLIIKDRSEALLVTLLTPIGCFCSLFAGGNVIRCIGPRWPFFLI